MATDTVNIDGHEVPADKVDLFYNGDGSGRVTDEQWDESKRRILEAEARGDDEPSWEPAS